MVQIVVVHHPVPFGATLLRQGGAIKRLGARAGLGYDSAMKMNGNICICCITC
jgi:hypothetical protein